MKYTVTILLIAVAFFDNSIFAQKTVYQGISTLQSVDYSHTIASTGRKPVPPAADKKVAVFQITDRKEKVREALLPLLRGVFNTHWQNQQVLLAIDAGWRNDSLSIEYKYYRGNNVLTLNEDMLVEKIYFTVRPEEIDELDTENDEFLFLYLRNTGKKPNIYQSVTRPGAGEKEDYWRSSLGVPVRAENLQMIIQYLKDLRTAE